MSLRATWRTEQLPVLMRTHFLVTVSGEIEQDFKKKEGSTYWDLKTFDSISEMRYTCIQTDIRICIRYTYMYLCFL